MTLETDNHALAPPEAAVIGGWVAEKRTVVITPAKDAVGSTRVTVTVSDGADSASDSFILSVLNSTFGGVQVNSRNVAIWNSSTCWVSAGIDSTSYVRCLDTCRWNWDDQEDNINTGSTDSSDSDKFTYFPLCDPYWQGLAVPSDVQPAEEITCVLQQASGAGECSRGRGQMFLTPTGYQFSSYAGCVQITQHECLIWLACTLPCCDSNCTSQYCGPATCNYRGACNHTTATCICDASYYDPYCATYCDPYATCNAHGACSSNGTCVCVDGYAGSRCEYAPLKTSLYGYIRDAMTGAPLANISISLTAATVLVSSTTSQSSGAYTFGSGVDSGAYNITAHSGSYLNETALVSPAYNVSSIQVDLYLSPLLQPNQTRIVMSWFNVPPRDLDIHVLLPFVCLSSTQRAVSYAEPSCEFPGAAGNASLSVDNRDRSLYALPETVTLTSRYNGTFSVYVNDHSTDAASYPSALSSSMVRVTLHSSVAWVSFTVAAAPRNGSWWHVCNFNPLNGFAVQKVDTWSDTAPY